VLQVNVYYREYNALAAFGHRRTKRKRIVRRGLDLSAMAANGYSHCDDG